MAARACQYSNVHGVQSVYRIKIESALTAHSHQLCASPLAMTVMDCATQQHMIAITRWFIHKRARTGLSKCHVGRPKEVNVKGSNSHTNCSLSSVLQYTLISCFTLFNSFAITNVLKGTEMGVGVLERAYIL